MLKINQCMIVGIITIITTTGFFGSLLFLIAMVGTNNVPKWPVPDWGDYMGILGAIISIAGIYTVTRGQIKIQKQQFDEEHKLQVEAFERQEFIQAITLISSNRIYEKKAGIMSLVAMNFFPTNNSLRQEASRTLSDFVKQLCKKENRASREEKSELLRFINTHITNREPLPEKAETSTNQFWLDGVEFYNMDFSAIAIKHIIISNCTFINCNLSGCSMFNLRAAKELIFHKCNLTDFEVYNFAGRPDEIDSYITNEEHPPIRHTDGCPSKELFDYQLTLKESS